MSATIYCPFVTQSNANDSKAGLDLIGLADTVALGTPDEILAQMEEGREPLYTLVVEVRTLPPVFKLLEGQGFISPTDRKYPLQLRRVTPLGIALDFFNIDTEPPADHAAVFIPFTNIIDIAALPD